MFKNNLTLVIIENFLISPDQNVSILFVNKIYFGKILELFGTWKLDEFQSLCEFCRIFMSDFWAQNVLMPSNPKCVLQGNMSYYSQLKKYPRGKMS